MSAGDRSGWPLQALGLFAGAYTIGMGLASLGCNQGGNDSAAVCGSSPHPGAQSVVWLLGLSGLAGVAATGASRRVRALLILAGAVVAPLALAVPSLFGLS